MGGSNTAVFSEAFSLPVMVILYIMTALTVIIIVTAIADDIHKLRVSRRAKRVARKSAA
jgi:hypothetical protein